MIIFYEIYAKADFLYIIIKCYLYIELSLVTVNVLSFWAVNAWVNES